MNLLAAIIDATLDQEAGRPPVEAEDLGQAIRLDLHPALAVLGYYDGVYVVISDLPAGARLSAGRSNNNGTWSLLPDELETLTIIPPESEKSEFLLTVSIATPDPDGYDFASMTAQFHVHVTGGTSTIPFNSLKRIEAQRQQEWPDPVQRAVQTSHACKSSSATIRRRQFQALNRPPPHRHRRPRSLRGRPGSLRPCGPNFRRTRRPGSRASASSGKPMPRSSGPAARPNSPGAMPAS